MGPLVTDDATERARRQAQLQEAEADFDPLPFDADAARAFGQVAASLRSKGRKPAARALDALIAATAIANGLPLYTCNPEDFDRIDGLDLRPIPHPDRGSHPGPLGSAGTVAPRHGKRRSTACQNPDTNTAPSADAQPEREAPSSAITFLFSDIEGSTRLALELGDGFPALLARHHALLREAWRLHDGRELSTEGDSFAVVFADPLAAVRAAADAQRALATEPWPPNAEVRVRIGVHTGVAVAVGHTYVGIEVHRAARIAAAGHGGQTLLSDITAESVAGALAGDLTPGTSAGIA